MLKNIQALITELLELRDQDAKYVDNAIPYVITHANEVSLPTTQPLVTPHLHNNGPVELTIGQQDNMELENQSESEANLSFLPDAIARYRFILQRYCGQESHICMLHMWFWVKRQHH